MVQNIDTFLQVKQKHLNGRVVAWQRGKGLGGSTGINFLAYSKPSARDIDGM